MDYFEIDLKYIRSETLDCNFENSNILITGCAGFLGYYLINYFEKYKKELKINSIVGLDSFLLGYPNWLKKIASQENSILDLVEFDIGKDKLENSKKFNGITHIIHMASIASPTFYRKFPIETVDANIWGLRNLLDFYCKSQNLRGFLFFSSSEIYGDPDQKNIPTNEDYRGLVSCTGPRACYDEAKRFGETLCCIYRETYDLPLTIVRPFNNYGPGMRIDDKRLPADMANCIIKNKPIILFSNGQPTRTFCYVADAICGYIKALNSGLKKEFNIGIDSEETSVLDFAKLFRNIGRDLINYNCDIEFANNIDKKYLVDNPNRRCPDIRKARIELNYDPKITIIDGINRYLSHLIREHEYCDNR